jgi:inward rectifier potassium channel
MSELGATRVFGHVGRGVKTIGLRRKPLSDLYYALVTGSWTRLVVVYAAVYFVTKALFGGLHLLVPEAAGAEPLTPAWLAAGALSSVEGFVRWLELILGACIIIAKYSRIPARILFGELAVVAPYQGGRALMFRMANERTSHIVDAKVHVMLVRNELSEDGDLVRRAHDLDLVRGGSALFTHAWTAIHPIARESPLATESADTLAASEAELIVTLSGYDEALTRVIHARHVYPARAVRWNARLAEIVKVLPNGARAVDYRRFHDVVSTEPTPERIPARSRAVR